MEKENVNWRREAALKAWITIRAKKGLILKNPEVSGKKQVEVDFEKLDRKVAALNRMLANNGRGIDSGVGFSEKMDAAVNWNSKLGAVKI